MTEEKKIALFKVMLELEHKAEVPTYDNRDYYEQANGAFLILQALGLGREYIRWAEGK